MNLGIRNMTKGRSLLSLLALFLCIEFSYADIKWPLYSQQCRDDAGPPFVDDKDNFGRNGFYHDKTAAYPVLQEDGSCAKPLQQACQDRPTYKAAYLEGPISCNNNGWYCRIMPDENWPPENLTGDLNFGHCNTTATFEDPGRDSDGHCHGSSVDSTYYWWIRDHFFRRYNGRLRCCCGWYQDTSTTPLFSRRITNRCDYRRLVTEAENLEDCRDANEGHGLGYELGCDSKYKPAQNKKPIPEDDDICWEVQRFGDTDQEYTIPTSTPTASPAPTNIPTPLSSSICTVEGVLGGTYYFPAVNACWRLQLYQTGTLEGDFTDPTCKNHTDNGTFQSGGIFSRFGSIDQTNDVINFIEGDFGYFGTFQFVRKPTSTTTSIEMKSDGGTKEYEIQVNVPTCTAPSMLPSSAPITSTRICPIENFLGGTYFFTVKGIHGCFKANINVDGKLKADLDKVIEPCSRDTFNPTGTFSIFDKINQNTDKAVFRDGPLGWSGTLQFISSSSSSGKELEGTIKNMNQNEQEFEVQITVPSCDYTAN